MLDSGLAWWQQIIMLFVAVGYIACGMAVLLGVLYVQDKARDEHEADRIRRIVAEVKNQDGAA